MEETVCEEDPCLDSMTTPSAVSNDNSSRLFECSICLDTAYDPVVTLCGHLYCWPCMYEWISVKSSFPDPEQHPPTPRCPVCKTNISVNTLVPLYGHPTSGVQDLFVPSRPSPSTLNRVIPTASRQSQQTHSNIPRSSQHFHDPDGGGYASTASSNLCVTAIASFVNPMIVTFGELVPAGIFGMSDMRLLTLPYPTSSPITGSLNPRMRRHEMKLEESLNRLTIFLLCCIVLCLLLF